MVLPRAVPYPFRKNKVNMNNKRQGLGRLILFPVGSATAVLRIARDRKEMIMGKEVVEEISAACAAQDDRRHPVEGVQLRLFLSNGKDMIIERDAHGLRILHSSYAWLNPPKRSAYYLNEESLGGGRIRATSYFVGEDGELPGDGRPFESMISVTGRVQISS